MNSKRKAAASVSSGRRLAGLDALRGVAALMVLLFHYTTRYEQKFGHISPPAFSAPWGFLGVNLFFMISGFVIFMTLERTIRPADFVVSRFSRLFPIYWVALFVTVATLNLFPSLGKQASLSQALGNMSMIQGLFGIEHVDSVYWTLEVELLFYWSMFVLWLSGQFSSSARWIGAWLLMCAAFGLANRLNIHFPYVISNALILPYFPYFALGILLYRLHHSDQFRWPVEGLLAAFALVDIALIDAPIRALLAFAFVGVFLLILTHGSRSRPVLVMARMGAISYPIYLLHENVGWTLIQALEKHGVGANVAILLTTAAVFVLAAALHVVVEDPAMRAIRSWRKRRVDGRVAASGNQTVSTQSGWLRGTLFVGLIVIALSEWVHYG